MRRITRSDVQTVVLRNSYGGTRRRLRTTLVLLTALALLLASQTFALAGQPSKDFVAGPDRLEFLKVLQPLATLKLQNGNQIQFVEMRGERERLEGIATAEIISPGQRNVGSLERLRGANALEVFNALTPRGTEIPRQMIALYGKPEMGRQGWALPSMELVKNPGGTAYPHGSGCLDGFGDPVHADWDAALANGLANHSHNFISMDDGPLTRPDHWHYATTPPNTSAGSPFYDLYGQANAVTAFSVAIKFCETAVYHAVDGEYVGNDVTLFTRPISMSTTGNWLNVIDLGKLDDLGKVIAFDYQPGNAFSPSASEVDFRIQLKNASGQTDQTEFGKNGDTFHIGATWNKKAAGGFTTAN